MSFLLDTNVVSELRKRAGVADDRVRTWADGQSRRELFISVVTLFEIEVGVARIERRDRRQGEVLRRWVDSGLLAGFADRILPIDPTVARHAAGLHVPDPRPQGDAFIAATAAVHGMTVVTRNTGDFERTGVPVLNPWRSP